MKKLFLIASGLFFLSQTTNAQTTTTKTGSTKFGLKAGVNLPSYKQIVGGDEYDTQSSVNFHVTGYADLPLSTNFYVQPGLSLQGKGSKSTFKLLGNDYKNTYNTMAIEVPVNFVGKVNAGPGKLYIGAGPYAAATIAGNVKSEVNNNTSTTTDLNFGNESGDDQKVFDFGVNFLGGYEFNSGLLLGGGYGYGISNLRPNGDSNNKTNNRVWSFSVGYTF